MNAETYALVLAAAGAGIVVYLLANPYVPFNFLFHRQVLDSNLGNSRAMYEPRLTRAGLSNGAYLIAAGTSPVVAMCGCAGAIALGIRAIRLRRATDRAEIRRRSTGLLLAVPAVCVLGQCMLFATAKPGEFGRFMLMADIFLMIEAVVALATFMPNTPSQHALAGILVLTTAVPAMAYLRGFQRDSARSPAPGSGRPNRPMVRRGQAHARRQRRSGPILPAAGGPVSMADHPAAKGCRGHGGGIGAADVWARVVDVQPPQETESRRWLNLWTVTPISWADKPIVLAHR